MKVRGLASCKYMWAPILNHSRPSVPLHPLNTLWQTRRPKHGYAIGKKFIVKCGILPLEMYINYIFQIFAKILEGTNGPLDSSVVAFWKTIQSFRKCINYSEITVIFLRKFSFLRKISKRWIYFTRISEFFRKKFKIFNFYDTSKSTENSLT